jgi:hypothetical protein
MKEGTARWWPKRLIIFYTDCVVHTLRFLKSSTTSLTDSTDLLGTSKLQTLRPDKTKPNKLWLIPKPKVALKVLDSKRWQAADNVAGCDLAA